jgi:hypothetical protein
MLRVVQAELGRIEEFGAALADYLEALDLRLIEVYLRRLLQEHLVPRDELLRE